MQASETYTAEIPGETPVRPEPKAGQSIGERAARKVEAWKQIAEGLRIGTSLRRFAAASADADAEEAAGAIEVASTRLETNNAICCLVEERCRTFAFSHTCVRYAREDNLKDMVTFSGHAMKRVYTGIGQADVAVPGNITYACCGEQAMVPSTALGLWPSSPTFPEVFFDEGVLQVVHVLHHHCGLAFASINYTVLRMAGVRNLEDVRVEAGGPSVSCKDAFRQYRRYVRD